MFIKTIIIPEKGQATVILSAEDFSGEEALILSKSEYNRLANELEEGKEVTEELYDRLKSAAERSSVIVEAVSILRRSGKSRRELARSLKLKKFSDDSVKYALKFVVEKGYLDEKRDCQSKAERLLRQNHYGRQRISTYLYTHGYDLDLAKSTADELDDNDIREALRYNIRKKFPNIADFDRSQRDKAVASLIRLGFSASEIFSEIKEIESSTESETE